MDSLSFDSPLPLSVELATYLSSRRETILNIWRTACQNDPAVNTTANLSREEFNNKVPFMLNEFERRLRQEPLEADAELLAAEHGLHRWQKGYALHELLGEVQHLYGILLGELRQYWQMYPTTAMQAGAQAYEHLAWFNALSIKGSIEQYTELQRIAASGRVQTLEKTLEELNELMRHRGNLLRTASHDLRGGFGVIQSAASYLNLVDADEADRRQMVEMLNRNLTTVRDMVVQLMDLARLEAGQEPISIQSFDVGQILHTLVDSYQPLAQQQGLVLKADGPSELVVESDPLHLQRIVQNLVLNALKHTKSGWVSVSWSTEDTYRWVLSIQDSGPGLPNQQAGSLSQVLAPSPESTAAFGIANPEADAREEAVTQSPKSFSSKGEGIGLSIVKKLCELLGASLEIETRAGWGTLFRIRLPLSHQER